MRIRNLYYIAIFLLIAFLIRCTPEPEPIYFGDDICVHCKMVISDPRYGGELLTKKGRAYKFDSVECLAFYLKNFVADTSSIHSLYVIDFNRPKQMIDARMAYYVKDSYFKSPMGLNLAAFSDSSIVKSFMHDSTVLSLNLEQVVNLVDEQWGSN